LAGELPELTADTGPWRRDRVQAGAAAAGNVESDMASCAKC